MAFRYQTSNDHPVYLRTIFRSLRLTIGLVAFIFALVGALPIGNAISRVQAQGAGSAKTYINYPETVETADGKAIGLNLYFTIIDSNGKAVPNAQIKSAQIVLDTASYPAQVSQATTPIYIVLAVDASGHMFPFATPLKAAVRDALSKPPKNSQFELITFAESSTVVETFVSDANRIINDVTNLHIPTISQATCLYDVAYESVQNLAQAGTSGRRAMILFTDGRDETLNSPKPCSQHTMADVVDLATRDNTHVPINTVGFKDSTVDIANLRLLAQQTGGLAVVGDATTLTQSFDQIMQGISSQLVASATVYPTQGAHDAILRVTLVDGSVLELASPPGHFTTSKNYVLTPTADTTGALIVPTPIPPSVSIDSVATDPATGDFLVNLSVQGEQSISRYEFGLQNVTTGLVAEQPSSQQPPLQQPIRFSVSDLKTGDYVIVVRAYDKSGLQINLSADKTQHKVHYDAPLTPTPTASSTPVPIGANLDTIQLNDGGNQFILQVRIQNGDQIKQFVINFINANGGKVKEYDLAPNTTLTLPVEIPAGDYTIRLQAVDDKSQVLSTSEIKYRYAPPTATPSATVTLTATAILPTVGISGITQQDAQHFIFKIDVTNPTLISGYRLEFVDQNTNLLVDTQTFSQLNNNSTLIVSFAKLTGGKYDITIKALDQDGKVLSSNKQTIGYFPPTVTPVPSAAPSATPLPQTFSGSVAKSASTILVIALPVLVIILGAL
ncbi:MAG: VWA domain-containing protein, partial [Aggregatilineales bacterium]